MIERADVILFDALIDPSILDFAKPDARRIDVGKRCGRHAVSQAAINRLLLQFTRQGARVVRLKGGDPFIFGRGGEELDFLRQAGVAVEVVPGVTAACAAAAGLQVPLTHRGLARSVSFVTGHHCDSPNQAHDLKALAATGGTIAAYMAGRTLPALAENLIGAGMPASTPAVAVQSASGPAERRCFGTLATLPAQLAEACFEGPTLILIGDIVGLAEQGRETVSEAA